MTTEDDGYNSLSTEKYSASLVLGKVHMATLVDKSSRNRRYNSSETKLQHL